jgi:hypothetical protein
MIVNIRDPQTLRQINPTSVSTYLQQKGWHEQKHVEGKVAFWTKNVEDNEEVKISLPLDPKLADFHFRISEILQALAIVEHRLPEEIFNDLVNLVTQRTKKHIHVHEKNIEFDTFLIRFVRERPSYKAIAAFSTILIMVLILLFQADDIHGVSILALILLCLSFVFSRLEDLSISLGAKDPSIDLEKDEI